MENDEFLKRILRLVAKYEFEDEVYWNTDLQFYVKCLNLHLVGFPSRERITEKNIELLEECLELATYDGVALFLCKVVGHKPAPWYRKHIDQNNMKYFDEIEDNL